jgi:hypothetical protein
MKFKTAFILAIIGLVLWLIVDGLQKVGDNQGYEPDQPIAFSHKIHAGENEIQCMYCHYGSERSRHAGIPATSVCLNCHNKIKSKSPEIIKLKKAITDKKPIEWVKVHRLADFAYFSHEQHVGSGKLKCQTCHGPVEKMTRMRQYSDLSMGWCLECHRNSDVTIHENKTTEKLGDAGGQDCAKCHY